MLPRRWNTRHGWRTAVRVFVHRLRAERLTYLVAVGWLLGARGDRAGRRARLGAHPGRGCLTALVGMAAGGGMIWIVRVIGAAALRREAMGFGDVTLMSMIGAFVGWQGALDRVLSRAVLRTGHRRAAMDLAPRARDSLRTVSVPGDVFRDPQMAPLWDRGYDLFALGWLLPALLAVCLVLMGLMLWGYRIARERAERRG